MAAKELDPTSTTTQTETHKHSTEMFRQAITSAQPWNTLIIPIRRDAPLPQMSSSNMAGAHPCIADDHVHGGALAAVCVAGLADLAEHGAGALVDVVVPRKHDVHAAAARGHFTVLGLAQSTTR